MTLYVKEYEWMWNDLQLTLAECRVYAYIHGLTHGAKGGYDGSKRGLAKALGLSEACVRDTLNALKDKSLISYTNGLWQSESRTTDDNAHSVRTDDAQSVRESANSVRESAQSVRSPHTPLYNNINNKKEASMQTLFEKFWLYFKPSAEYQNRKAATQMLFEARSEVAQKAIVEAAQEGGGCHPCDQQNPYFYVQDFPEPQPYFLTGVEQDNCRVECIPLVQVKYNGRFRICTRDTMKDFNLEWVRDW